MSSTEIEKINYHSYMNTLFTETLALDYNEFEENIISTLNLEEEDSNFNNIEILLKNDNLIFISSQFLYLPIKVKNWNGLEEGISSLTKENTQIDKKINFKLLSYKEPSHIEELSEIVYFNYLLNGDSLTEINNNPSLCNETIKNFIISNELFFIYISLDNSEFKIEEEKKEIFYWIETIVCQVSEKFNANISFYKNSDYSNNIRKCYMNKINNINTEIIFDTMSQQYLSRAQKFYQDSPHMSYLEYYHILERFMKEHRFNIFIENYKEVYNILLSEKDEIKKKTEVINTYSNLDKKFTEVVALKNILSKVIDTSTFTTIIHRDVLGNTEKTNYLKTLKEHAPFWDQEDDFKIENQNSFQDKIAKRLYATRNSIVHSKSFDGEDTFDVDNEEHIRFLNVDLFILKYLVLKYLDFTFKGKNLLNHFFLVDTFID